MKKLIPILFLMLISTEYSAQTNTKDEFYKFLDHIITEKKIVFLELNLIKKCQKEYLFGISSMNYNDNLSIRYKTYDYKGHTIIFDLQGEINKLTTDFFKTYFKEKKINISDIPKGKQSIIREFPLYFINNQYVNDFSKTQIFINKECAKQKK